MPQETNTVRDSDIYVMDPIPPELASTTRCPQDFRREAAATPTIHVPGGAVDLGDESATFPDVNGSRWKGSAARAFQTSLVHGTLLWRTRDGRLMKTLQEGNAGENLIGQTIMADARGRFPDNGWLQRAKPERRAVSDGALASLQYTATISNDSLHPAYGSQPPLELVMPYLDNATFLHSSTIVCLHMDPQASPNPSVTWSLTGDRSSESSQTATLIEPASVLSTAAAASSAYTLSVLPGCQAIGDLSAGRLNDRSLGRRTRIAASHSWRRSLRFAGAVSPAE